MCQSHIAICIPGQQAEQKLSLADEFALRRVRSVEPTTATPLPRTYQIETRIGRGGFGEVYLARMVTTGGLSRRVALKILRGDVDPNDPAQPLERLRDEARMLATLEHPSILTVVDVTILERRIALITEYVEGEDLHGCVRSGLGTRGQIEAAGRIAGALDAAWRQFRVVHRDVKPSNIRISRHGTAKLLDFGIAKTDQLDRHARTATGLVVGSASYLPPERFLDPVAVPAGDVFSLGATLLRGLTGEPFYGLKSEMSRVYGLCTEGGDRYAEHLRGRLYQLQEEEYHPEIVTLLYDSLRRDKGQRLSAKAFAARCDAISQKLEGPTLSQWCRYRSWPEPPQEPGPWSGRTLSEGFTTEPHFPRLPDQVPSKLEQGRHEDSHAQSLLVAIAVLVVMMVVGLTGGGLSLAIWAGSGATTPPLVTSDATAPAPMPVHLEPSDAAPAPPPPAPAVPSPAPASPAPTESEDGVVLVSGAAVQLRAGDQVLSPGLVPPGEYGVWADFGDGFEDAGAVQILPGSNMQLHCNPLLRRCD